MLALLALAGGGPQELGLPFGASVERVKSVLSSAGISCKSGRGGALECRRPPVEVAGAAGLRLWFQKDRLVRAELEIAPGAKTFAAFRSRYIELKRQLTAKHGEPKTSLEYVDRFYVLADEEYRAIAEGKGEFTSTWKAGELEARLSLHGENGPVRLTWSYEEKGAVTR